MKSDHHRTTCFVIILLALALIWHNAFAARAEDSPLLKGWQQTEWGMTPAQVKAAMPVAQVLNGTPVTTVRGELLQAKLAIPGYEVAGISYEAQFLFNQKGTLKAVSLSHTGASAGAREAFQELIRLLAARYAGIQGTEMGPDREVWSTSDKLVKATLTSEEDAGKKRIEILFMPPNIAEASKL